VYEHPGGGACACWRVTLVPIHLTVGPNRPISDTRFTLTEGRFRLSAKRHRSPRKKAPFSVQTKIKAPFSAQKNLLLEKMKKGREQTNWSFHVGWWHARASCDTWSDWSCSGTAWKGTHIKQHRLGCTPTKRNTESLDFDSKGSTGVRIHWETSRIHGAFMCVLVRNGPACQPRTPHQTISPSFAPFLLFAN
jgi:hypothetical protein